METILDLPLDTATRTGFCTLVPLPLGVPIGNIWADMERSGLRVLENGVALGPAHARHRHIVGQGGGRFSHWGCDLYFSSSDNTDPATNGRRYQIAVQGPAWFDLSDLAWRARYEILQAERVKSLFWINGIDLTESTVLELGPGGTLASQLLLASAGVDMVVADPYHAPWTDGNVALYQRIAETGYGPDGALRRAIDRRHWQGGVRVLTEPAEALMSLADGEVDVVVSNAVLEHVADKDAAARELVRVSRLGAWQFHQIDLRDHRDFSRPLEYLLLPAAEFQAQQAACQHQRGCQWRWSELRQSFRAAGFETIAATVTQTAAPDYLRDFLPRLRASGSAYAQWSADDLACLGISMVARSFPPAKDAS